ncbi:hypothetical protein [Streptomyces albicerus]|uniref:hypothetical protein n=1 Tax=Streptomyces albicerus TaxID=2569859 RepID=UPI001788AFDD|nr:hypothetical protein [Streptomyces albicerus]
MLLAVQLVNHQQRYDKPHGVRLDQRGPADHVRGLVVHVPTGTGAHVLTIPVGRCVQVVSTNAIMTIKCDTCASCMGGSLRVDGPAATFVCAEGHTTDECRLEARRVRNALAYAGTPTGAEAAVEGDFLVTSRAHDEQSDPRSLSCFTAAYFR